MSATISNSFTEEQRTLLTDHLARVERETLPSILQALQQTQQSLVQTHPTSTTRAGTPGISLPTAGFGTIMGIHQLRMSSEVPRLEFSFNFDLDRQSALSDLRQIIGMFQVAGRILNDPGTHIDPYSGGSTHQDTYLWGHSDPPNRIMVGPAFFAPQPDDLQLLNVPAGRSDRLKIIRDSILVHESVHCHNGVGQHESRGSLANPYRYQAYLITFCCQIERLNHTPVELERLIG